MSVHAFILTVQSKSKNIIKKSYISKFSAECSFLSVRLLGDRHLVNILDPCLGHLHLARLLSGLPKTSAILARSTNLIFFASIS